MNIMKRKLKKGIMYIRKTHHFTYQTKAFRKRYKNIDHSLLKTNLNDSFIDTYKEKWKLISPFVEIDTLNICHNLSGHKDLNIIPENIFAAIIEPILNPHKDKALSFLSIKNIYNKWFSEPQIFPEDYLHKIDNIYYDNEFNVISDINKYLDEHSEVFDFPLVCKPSMGTAGGEGVEILNNIDELKSRINSYPSLVFQEFIIQSELLDRIYPQMNSIRTCLYRTKDGEFKVINNSIRFGVNGSLDNETAGGIVCNIDSEGFLNHYAVSKDCEKYSQHPNSGTTFKNLRIPAYENLISCALSIANQIPLSNLVSLDMCLDKDNNWRCLEINLNAQTIRFRQYAGYGFFGEYTDEVIERVLTKNSNKVSI